METENRSNQRGRGGASGKPVADGVGSERRTEVGVVVNLDNEDGVILEDDSSLHGRVGWSGKVVLVSSTTSRGAVVSLTVVDVRDELVGALREDLKQVELTASGTPARAVTVLLGSCDLGVQEPDSRHVLVGRSSSGGVSRHGEFKHKDLGVATESVVGNTAIWVVTTAVVGAIALVTGEDDVLDVGIDGHITESLGGGSTAGTVGRAVRE